MAELAAGAVTTLLGVIRNESQLLGRVRDDVQFIQEEMESMNSFLANLARKGAASGDHDEQVGTWMNQVRLLAQDCNNCIDLYLYRGNPDLHRARGGPLRRYVWSFPWFLHKLAAQHRAAIQLRALKERAWDIGERRLRYGVQVPPKAAAGKSPKGAEFTAPAPSAGAAHQKAETLEKKTVTINSSIPMFKPRTVEENVSMKVADWIKSVAYGDPNTAATAGSIPSLAIVAPCKEETRDIAQEALATCFGLRNVLVDIPTVHFYFKFLQSKDILYYILRELQPQQQAGAAGKYHRTLQMEKSLDIIRKMFQFSCRVLPKEYKSCLLYLSIFPRQQSIRRSTLIGRWVVEGLITKEDWPSSVRHANRCFDAVITKEEAIIRRKRAILEEKEKLFEDIKANITAMKVDKKIKELQDMIKQDRLQLDREQMNDDQELLETEPLGLLNRALCPPKNKPKPTDAAPATERGQGRKEATQSSELFNAMYTRTAMKLKEHMEKNVEAGAKAIRLTESCYEKIIRDVFPTTSKPLQTEEQEQQTKDAASTTSTIMLVEDQIKEMIRKVVQEVQEDKSVKKLKDGKPVDQIPDSLIIDTKNKIGDIQRRMKEQLEIKGIMDKINDCLGNGHQKILVILKLDNDYVSGWEEARYALSQVGCIAGALILNTPENTWRAKYYCDPPRKPIDYSLLGLYRDIVLEITKQKMNEDSSYKPQICLGILDKCKQDKFCMNIFVRALYANPKRSNEDLSKLHRTLQLEKSLDIIRKKMFQFSYSDLPKEYKSCLLYLAIFPRRQSIRRSTLIGRWVVERLITKEDWPSSVRHANRCFDALIDRWLLHPHDIGPTGQIKSCMVDDPVHGFITKIARKQRIVETRLSHHLARHFSIFNDLRLRSSDGIDKFFKYLSESSQLSVIKVLDLKGCQSFDGKNQRYLKEICSKMLLLKYLSLNGTNITQLPSEIYDLRELEVLDIRQTNVPVSATANVILLKLKRLLAGSIGSSPSTTEISTVQVPNKIDKMFNLEVLSNVKARNSQHLKDIRKLWQLRKLGVVIEKERNQKFRSGVDNMDKHLMYLFRAINDLHECLQSLSVTFLPMNEHKEGPSIREHEKDPSNQDFSTYVLQYMDHSPKLLESLSISGTTEQGQLLKLLAKDGDKLAKVTLRRTWLNQADLEVLAKQHKLLCLRLRCNAYTSSKLTFNKMEFKYLKFFLVEGSNMTDISFEEGAAPQLEKIVLCSADVLQSLSGIENLPKLKEIELKNSGGMLLSLFDKAKHISKVTLSGILLNQGDLQILAKKQNLRCLELLDISYVERQQLIFNKEEFPRLNLLIVDRSGNIEIIFTNGSAPKLDKIVWGMGVILSGIEKLKKLKELEFHGDVVPDQEQEAINKHGNKPVLWKSQV